jgi:hypothetical protein
MLLSIRRAVPIAVALLVATGAEAQQTYPQTLYWGAGLIDIPAAWVAPLTGDFALNYSSKLFQPGDPTITGVNYNDRTNSQLTFSMSAWGRLEAGVAFYTANPEHGFFGQFLLLNEQRLKLKGGALRWIPSIAVGMRNIGPFEHIDRFGAGYQLIPPAPGSPNYRHIADSVHQGFNTSNTVYGVATKDFNLAGIGAGWPDVDLGLTIGFGNGLFEDDGGLGDAYSENASGGLFGGIKVDFQPTPSTVLTLMAEHNAWDVNLGASLDYRGIRAGAYITELTAGSAEENTTASNVYYNYRKFAFTLGWQSNVFALLRGDFLRGRVAELERQREGLLAEINTRQQRVQALELEINRLEAQNLLELEQRRVEAEAQLRSEREALQRLEERLKVLEGRNPPPSQQPPPRE